MGEGKRKKEVQQFHQKTERPIRDLKDQNLESRKGLRRGIIFECRHTVQGRSLAQDDIVIVLDRGTGKVEVYLKRQLIGEVTPAGVLALMKSSEYKKGDFSGIAQVHTASSSSSGIFLAKLH